MPAIGRSIVVALAIAATVTCGTARAAQPNDEPLTTPASKLYHPTPEQRAWSRAQIGRPAAAASSDLVMDVQLLLKIQGYDSGPVDGRYGPMTRQAIMAFQTARGMAADAQITTELVAQLNTRPQVSPPPVAAVPTNTGPASPPATPVLWTLRHAIGKTVHALPGDQLGTVSDIVIGTDGTAAGLVVATVNGYGTHEGEAVVPWSQVGTAITQMAVILPLSADKALPLRDKRQTVTLAPGQWRLAQLTAAYRDGEKIGSVRDAVLDSQGKLVRFNIESKAGIEEIPATEATPADRHIVLKDVGA